MRKASLFLSVCLLAGAVALLSGFSQKTTAFSALLPSSEPDFQDFIKQFPEQKLPYSLDVKSLRVRLDQYLDWVNKDYSDDRQPLRPARLDWDYHKFLPELEHSSQFSRMPVMAEPVAMFQTDAHYAVLYAPNRGFMSGFTNYEMALFDKTGAYVSTYRIASVQPNTIVSAEIGADLQASVSSWQINWKKAYDEHGFEGNSITALSLLGTRSLDLRVPTPKKKSLFDEMEDQDPLPPAPELPEGSDSE